MERLKEKLKEIDSLCNKAAIVGEKAFSVDGNTIHISRKVKQEYLKIEQSIYDALEEYQKECDEYIERGLREGWLEYGNIELLDICRPKINGQTKYCRILIRLWKDSNS